MGLDEVLCKYVLEHERHNILTEAHGGVTGGNYAGKSTAQNILRAGLWWPTVHKEAKDICQACDVCQRP